MWDDVGILRDAKGLRAGAHACSSLRETLHGNGISGADLRYNLDLARLAEPREPDHGEPRDSAAPREARTDSAARTTARTSGNRRPARPRVLAYTLNCRPGARSDFGASHCSPVRFTRVRRARRCSRHERERHSASELERLMRDGACAQSAPRRAMAKATARALAAAELEGIASHGASRIRSTAATCATARANGSAVPVVVARPQGRVRGRCEARASRSRRARWQRARPMRRARELGVAFVSVANSNHFGVAAFHLEPVAAAGLVGIAIGNSPGGDARVGRQARALRHQSDRRGVSAARRARRS